MRVSGDFLGPHPVQRGLITSALDTYWSLRTFSPNPITSKARLVRTLGGHRGQISISKISTGKVGTRLRGRWGEPIQDRDGDRMRATDRILDRLSGKPAQHHKVNVDGEITLRERIAQGRMRAKGER